MANLSDVWDAIRASLIDVLGNAELDPPITSNDVFIDNPATDALQNIARGNRSLVSIFDMQMGRDVTRWPPFRLDPTVLPTTLVSEASGNLAPYGSQTITLTVDPTFSDAVSCVIGRGIAQHGAVAIAGVGDTPITMATKLANAITASSAVNTLISATAVYNVVYITNITATPLKLQTFTGNNGTAQTVWANSERVIMLSSWTSSEQRRRQVGNLIQQTTAKWMASFGLPLSDGTWVRIKINSDRVGRDNHFPDLYRWDFLITCEYSITTSDLLYSVLVPTFIKTVP